MKWFTAGRDVQYPIDFIVDGEFVIPAVASYTVYNPAGVVLNSGSLPVTTTSATLTVPAASNQIPSGQTITSRFVELSFTYEGRVYSEQLSYNLSPFVPLSVTPQHVRAELGLDSSELPDRDIDVLEAYFLTLADVGTDLTTALGSGTADALNANRAIAVRAALEVINSLQLRAASKMKAEDSEVSRFANFDLDALRNALGQRYSALTNTFISTTVEPINFAVSTPTDAITGA